MNRIDIGNFGRADDAVDPEVTVAGGGFADAYGLIGHLDVHRIGIGLGIDCDGADVEFLARPDNAYGNFPAIGYQNFFKHADLEAVLTCKADLLNWLRAVSYTHLRAHETV